jgi:hypothetical protein
MGTTEGTIYVVLKANRMRFIVEDERANPPSLCDANG